MENIAYAIEWVIIFIVSATLHEGAHALAAKKGCDLTAYAGGQVSLNPFVHMKRQPLGMLVFPLISSLIFGWPFGYASVPYDPLWAHNNPRKAAWMAAAGPAANLLIMMVCGAAIKIGIGAGVFYEPDIINLTSIVDAGQVKLWNGLAIFLSMMFNLNLILLVLNLLPLPPLDGSSILSLLLPEDSSRKYRSVVSNPAFGFLGLLVAWRVINPLIDFTWPWAMSILYWEPFTDKLHDTGERDPGRNTAGYLAFGYEPSTFRKMAKSFTCSRASWGTLSSRCPSKSR